MTIWSPNFRLTEEYGTRREQDNLEGKPRASVTLRGLYSQRKAIKWDLMYYRRDWPFNYGEDTLLPAPAPPPNNYELPYRLRVSSVTTRPTAEKYSPIPNDEICRYDGDCLFDVVYSPYEWTGPDEYGGGSPNPYSIWVKDEWQPSVEMWSLDHQLFEWETQDATNQGNIPLAPNEAPSIPTYEGVLIHKTRGWKQLPQSWDSYIGSVNGADYYSLTFNRLYKKGNLLLTDVDAKQIYHSYAFLDSTATQFYTEFELTFKYEHREGPVIAGTNPDGEDGWWYFWRSNCVNGQDTTGYYRLRRKECSANQQTAAGELFIPFPARDHSLWLYPSVAP